METQNLNEIKNRCDAASCGPWQTMHDPWERQLSVLAPVVGLVANVVTIGGRLRGQMDDADFIAHARQDVPDLLAEIDRLRAENAEWQRRWSEEHDAAVRNDELRRMAERLGAGYEQEYLDDPLSGALRSENESVQELSDSLRGAME